VLAGGRSTRFGRDKLAEPYRGAPLLHHAVLRLSEVCDEVVVVVAAAGGEPSLPPGVAARVVRDPVPGQGPLVGLSAALEAARTHVALVAAGDMPELHASVLREMLRVAADAPVEALALREGDRVRPLPCVVGVRRATTVARALVGSGHRALTDLLDALHVAAIDEATWVALDPERRTLLDVDEPGDLDRAVEGLGTDAAAPGSG